MDGNCGHHLYDPDLGYLGTFNGLIYGQQVVFLGFRKQFDRGGGGYRDITSQ